MKFFYTLLLIFGFSTLAYVVFAADQMKTTETMITDSEVAVSSNQTYPFTLYIGDNLSGVSSPLKSLHFTTSGVYTGGGSITFMIDNDGVTSKSFTLPNVGSTPTPFEIDYKDTTNNINPTSAGSYSYSLNFNPSGVTIYGLGIKMTETHRYKPSVCAGMPIYGDLTSTVFDSTEFGIGVGYNSIMWKGLFGEGNKGKVKFQFAAASDPSGPWNYYGGDTCGSLDWFNTSGPNIPVELIGTGVNASVCRTAWNNKRYFRYKIRICSDDCIVAGANTPIVDDVVVNWSP